MMKKIIFLIALITVATVPPDVFSNDDAKNQPTTVAMDKFDLGGGVILGLPTGIKGRLRYMSRFGLTIGADFDAGVAVIFNDATFSGNVGWCFRRGKRMLTPYLTVGTGSSLIFAVFTAGEGSITHQGIGIEWKPRRWIGFGAEGGVNTIIEGKFTFNDAESEIDDSFSYPFIRLSLMFYLL